MRSASWLVLSSSVVVRFAVVTVVGLASLATPGCTVGDGDFDFDWDGSLFDDAGLDGAADEDAAQVQDSGADDASDGDAGADSGSADSGEPDEELSPGDVARVIARGRCGALKNCLGEQLLLAWFEGNDCVEFTTRQLQDRHLHWLEDSVEAGRVAFRPERLEACELDLIQLGCDVTTTPWPANCEQAVEGRAAEDGDCTIDQDCQGSAYCNKGGELESCPGYCAPLQSEGLPCGSSAECAIGLWCRGGVCEQPPGEGDPCDSPLVVSECPAGLVCQGPSGESTCQAIDRVYSRRAGDDCDGFGQLCEFGLVCQSQSQDSTTGRCVAPAASGGECRVSQPSQCPADEYCRSAQSGTLDPAEPGSSGVCSPRPVAGEACDHEDCVPGARCLGEPKLCKSLKSAGGSCESNGECYGGLCTENICSVTTIGC